MSQSELGQFRARAVISTDALRQNFDHVRELAGVNAMAVVKADAYGHGVRRIAPLMREHGVEWLGVALPSEALALRASGDTGKILAWLSTPGDPDISACVVADVDLSVSSVRELEEVTRAAEVHDRVANVHVKIDTGLSRNGMVITDLHQFIPLLVKATELGQVHLRGVWTHLANADHQDREFSAESVQRQVEVFESALTALAAAGLRPDLTHVANTAGALWHPSTRYDLVRVGIGMYGLSPNVERATATELGLVPAMHVQARISQVKEIPTGAGVSYSHTWVATEPTRVGLVPVGYADGIPRNLSNNLEFALNGQQVTQVGTIAMDQCVVNLNSHNRAQAGDVIDIFGPGASGELTADQWAQRMNSVGYEIVTRIGTRIPKEYI
jgi:alanine racemase